MLKKIRIKPLFFIVFAVAQLSVSRGPIQPEYATYESVNNTDMVNLATGDFVYTMPLVHVPGPGGGFTVPLTYHAGIELEEESSWVGLGWSLNAGAITRTVNQYADDFAGETMDHVSQSPGGHGYSVNWGVYSKYYDSRAGKGGRAGLGSVLSVGFGNDAGLTVIGVSANIRSLEVSATPESVAMGIIEAASYAMIPADGGATAIAVNAAVSAASAVGGSMIANASSDWSGKITNQNRIETREESGWFNEKKSYSYYFYGTRTDRQYGLLYLGEVENDSKLQAMNGSEFQRKLSPFYTYPGSSSTISSAFVDGAVSDVSVNSDSEYPWSQRPPHLAIDAFNVAAEGVAGRIAPYRVDIGSVAFNPSEFDPTNNHHEETVTYSIKKWLNSNSLSGNYKTQFKYTSELSNKYTHHNGAQSIFNSNNNAEINESYSTFSNWTGQTYGAGRFVTYNFSNDLHSNETKYYEANRADQTLLSGQLATGKYIQYFTNQELAVQGGVNDPTLNSVYQDHQAAGINGRSLERNLLPPKGIGGFVITNADGTSYHFTLPVYKNMEHYFNGTSASNKYEFWNNSPVAITWLLTGITGSDYVDRGELGVIDEQDWGYWVKMDYGKFTSEYRFSSPYNDTEKKRSLYEDQKTIKYRTKQENYYLDRITTATHTALFVKSIKDDGKSYFSTYNSSNDQFVNSLKLDEVVILKNSDKKHLFEETSSGGLGLNKNNDIGSIPHYNGVIGSVLTTTDISATQSTFIELVQQKKIEFNYDYSLCQNTPNSFHHSTPPTNSSQLGTGGKLTLNSIATYGEGNIKLQPDFQFEYLTPNPNYDQYKHDGWGYYSSTAFDANNAHLVSDDGSAWSLSKIITPIGSEIEVEYERDSYYSLSGANGDQVFHHLLPDVGASSIDDATNILRVEFESNYNVSNFYSIGNQVKIEGQVSWAGTVYSGDEIIQGNKSIVAIGSDYIEVNIGESPVPNNNEATNWTTIKELNALLIPIQEKDGGGIRVKSITVKDENNNESVSRYVYTQDGEINSATSGVCSMEPEYIHVNSNLVNYPQYQLYDFPGPFIMYDKVTVYNHYKSATDYLSKEEYNFETPNIDMVKENSANVFPANGTWNSWTSTVVASSYTCYSRTNNYNTIVNTAKIGQLKSIASYNSQGMKYKSIRYDYNDIPAQVDLSNVGIGYFTEGCLLTERIYNASPSIYYRNYKSLKLHVPSKMISATIEENGYAKTIENKAWDFITGSVLETEYENSFGDRFRTQEVPAYTKYSKMGHILSNPTNKHMLVQSAGSYLYTEDDQQSGQWNLLAANAVEWSDQWQYREYNNGDWAWGAVQTDMPWRQKKGYYWKAPINQDGTYKTGTGTSDDFVDFNWANPSSSNLNWISSGEALRYSENSVLLESKSYRNVHSSRKTNNANSKTVLSAYNAKYTEVAYSGAEDEMENYGTDQYFNHEIALGGGSIETDINNVHSGKKSIELVNADYGFLYRLSDLGNSIDINRNYQISIWVKNAVNSSQMPTSAVIAAQFLQGGKTGTVVHTKTEFLSASNTKKAGDWYQMIFDVPVHSSGLDLSSADYLKIQTRCVGTGASVYMDDFRFYPVTSNIATSVYDFETGQQVAVLDNNNMATRVHYDIAGRLIKTEIELLDSESPDGIGGFKKQSENKYNYGRNL